MEDAGDAGTQNRLGELVLGAPITPATKPLVVLSRVVCNDGYEGELVTATILDNGEIRYGVKRDDGSDAHDLSATAVQEAPDPFASLVERKRRDLLNRIVYLDEGAFNKGLWGPRRDHLCPNWPAQVVGIGATQDARSKPGAIPTSELRLTLFFYLNDEDVQAGFTLDEIVLASPFTLRQPVERVDF